MDILRRVTDLFIEGTILPLGSDSDGDVVVWLNKLNSFEVEEARRDGVAQRGLRLIQLSTPTEPEARSQAYLVGQMDDDALRQDRVDQMADEVYLNAMNDVEAEEGWGEKIEILRRLPTLLADEKASEDDPRREQLADLNREYLAALRSRIDRLNRDALADQAEISRKQLEKDYLEAWRQRVTLDTFMAERRKTEVYLSLRKCDATRIDTPAGPMWSHDTCSHQRLLNERSQVNDLPEGLLQRISDALDGVTVPDAPAGNSDAPASSSDSSEPSSEAEATSAPSSPEETRPGAATT